MYRHSTCSPVRSGIVPPPRQNQYECTWILHENARKPRDALCAVVGYQSTRQTTIQILDLGSARSSSRVSGETIPTHLAYPGCQHAFIEVISGTSKRIRVYIYIDGNVRPQGVHASFCSTGNRANCSIETQRRSASRNS